ncbi:hypothetical protein LX64_00175 [Chitinophaga skermanii]|uniref:Uncharacterized protein n=1 Tax=Chitinophaga skermanii TaxID=331697 RepID=A0A327R1R0_9BACT|nr:hypothetical protein [Chitinophaga skermanii]RAJ10571.1 hypothetical protein LX64_00175 [Chitinophaga skermanii]
MSTFDVIVITISCGLILAGILPVVVEFIKIKLKHYRVQKILKTKKGSLIFTFYNDEVIELNMERVEEDKVLRIVEILTEE